MMTRRRLSSSRVSRRSRSRWESRARKGYPIFQKRIDLSLIDRVVFVYDGFCFMAEECELAFEGLGMRSIRRNEGLERTSKVEAAVCGF